MPNFTPTAPTTPDPATLPADAGDWGPRKDGRITRWVSSPERSFDGGGGTSRGAARTLLSAAAVADDWRLDSALARE